MKLLRIVLNPKFKDLAGFVSELTRSGVPVKARKIYDIRNKVYVYKVNGHELNIKSFKVPNLIQGIIYSTLRKSKARRSYENARRLLSLGFETPMPVAYIEVRNFCRLKQSYYISLQVEADDVRSARNTECAAEIEQAVAELMVNLHDTGVLHKDFTDRNVLYNRDAHGAPHLMLIDLNRMQFDVKKRSKLLGNFARIYGNSENETASLARRYAKITGARQEAFVAKIVKIFNAHKVAKIRNHRLKNLFKT